MTAIVRSVQPFSVAIPNLSTSATVTLTTAVTTANAAIFYGGQTATSGVTTGTQVGSVTLTSSTVVTATRNGTTGVTTVYGTVVEFYGTYVNSVQYGTVALSAATSGTATISAVGANAFVIPLGANGSGLSVSLWSTVLTNATTVTVTNGSGTTTGNFSFVVVDLTSTAVASVQQVELVGASPATVTNTRTITAVAVANCLVINNGQDTITGTALTGTVANNYVALTSTTVVTWTRAVTAGSRTENLWATVVQFQSAVLTANGVQAGTITLAAGAGTAVITTVGTLAVVTAAAGWTATSSASSWGGFLCGDLLQSIAVVAAGSGFSTMTNVVSYQVIDWAINGFAPMGNTVMMLP